MNTVSENEKSSLKLMYLLGLVTFIFGPLFIWLKYRKDSELIDYHGKELLNLFITLIALHFVAYYLWSAIVGVFLTLLVIIYHVSMISIGLSEGLKGERFRLVLGFRIFNRY